MSDLLQINNSTNSNLIMFPIRGTESALRHDQDSKENIPTPIFDSLIEDGAKLNSISSYKSTFNYEVYRSLEKRYSKTDIRGGIICKTDLKLVNFHPSCFKCHYTLELDTYGRGCIHECAYCYAKDELSLHGYWNNPIPFPINVNEIRNIFYTVFETNKKSKWRDILEKRIPIRIGSMSDSFMWSELKNGVTFEVLKILNHYRYPYLIFTRSDLVAHEKYIKVLDPELCSVQFSICGNNSELTKIIEPGAPSIKRRIDALAKLSEAGIWTAVRINPLFPKYADGYFSDPDSVIARFGSLEASPVFNLFDIDNCDEFMFDLANAGVKTLLTGFVRLKSSALNMMNNKAGIDLKPFFRPEVMNTGLRGNREKKYADKEIRQYYLRIAAAAQRHGLRFTTCYIGNGAKDYFQYRNLWANKSDCCDIRGNVGAFASSSQEIPWEQRKKHTTNASLVAASMEEEKKLDLEYSSTKKSHSLPTVET